MSEKFKTFLYQEHIDNSAKIIDFHGWLLPLEYEGILKEAKNTRLNCGIFDVSHMGRVIIKGKNALDFLQYLTFNDLSLLKPSRAQYNLIANKSCGIVDDCIIYNLEEKYLCIVNASNHQKDLNWFKENILPQVHIEDISSCTGLISIQGPHSKNIMESLFKKDFSYLSYMSITKIDNLYIARTGYTGEDGFEIIVPQEEIISLWRKIIEKGKDYKLSLCGLGARDILRIEAGYPLYGNELDETTTPYEASLDWVVKEKDFIGKEMWQKRKNMVKIKRVGFVMLEKGFPRKDYLIFSSDNNKTIGKVTSGTYSPNLDKFIGMGYIYRDYLEREKYIKIKIRENYYLGEVVSLPFISPSVYKNAPIAQQDRAQPS